MNAVEATGLTKSYGTLRALDALDLTLSYGQVVGLLGENGCGKSTLLKVLAGVQSDWTGQLLVTGDRPGPASKGRVSFLPDSSFLPEQARVSALIELYGDFFADFEAAKASDLIGFFGLRPEQKLKEMSKGMKEKVQIALVMGRKAKLFLLDEPVSGIDPAARDIVLDGIVRGLGDDSTVLISTHLIHDLEPILDSVVMMRFGKVLLTGQVDDLRSEHHQSIDQLFRKVYRWSAR